MPEVFDQLKRHVGSAPRRGVLRALAATGLGVFVATGSGREGLIAKPKKKKKNRCQGCPKSCTFEFKQAGGGKICGIGSNAPSVCRPCISSQQCADLDINFPHCVIEATILSLGQTLSLACPASPPGLCTSVPACVT